MSEDFPPLEKLLPELQRVFPRVDTTNVKVTSPEDPLYNCIAFAAGEQRRWWWPATGAHWPPHCPRENNLQSFKLAFGKLGYLPCSTPVLEEGIEKVAIFAQDEIPTHGARQVSDGWWVSKLGQSWDIQHKLEALEGEMYGEVALVLARPLKKDSSSRRS